MQRLQVQMIEMLTHAGRRTVAMDCRLFKEKEDSDKTRKDQAGSSDSQATEANAQTWKLEDCGWMDFNRKAADQRWNGKLSSETDHKDQRYQVQRSEVNTRS